jgi:predicted pyridoxine 5'-phosphate oxidase superfamily flavin-nucleotide-binding protein
MIHTKLQDFDMTTGANDADLAFFTPAMKPMLHRFGTAEDLSRTEGGSVKTQLGPSETAFIAGRDSFYIAAIGEDRWPYTQRHRGPKGLLRVLDTTILGFASMASTRRYISPGNALLFLIDHTLQARLKIWADAEVSEDAAIIEKLARTRGLYPAARLAFLFHVRGFGWNHEKHNMEHTAGEVNSAKPARTGTANPIQRDWIEQKQKLLGPTCIEPASFATEYPNKI